MACFDVLPVSSCTLHTQAVALASVEHNMELCAPALAETLTADNFLPHMHKIAADAPEEWNVFKDSLCRMLSPGILRPSSAGGIDPHGSVHPKLLRLLEGVKVLSVPLQMCISSEPKVCCKELRVPLQMCISCGPKVDSQVVRVLCRCASRLICILSEPSGYFPYGSFAYNALALTQRL